MSIVLEWNGVDVPDQLRGLPRGRYVLVSLDEAVDLTSEEEAGLVVALAPVRAGRTVPAAEAERWAKPARLD